MNKENLDKLFHDINGIRKNIYIYIGYLIK